MHVIFPAVFLISLGQYYCLPRTCTMEERCLPVDASVCDNSKCLLLNKSDVDMTVNSDLKPFAWNIARLRFCTHCPMSLKYEMPDTYGKGAMIGSFTLKSGKNCSDTMTVACDYAVDPDPSTGQVRLFTIDFGGYKSEECYLHLKPGKELVYRKCMSPPGYPSGQACASIIAKTAASEKCLSDDLVDFVRKLDIDLPQITVDCV